MIYLIIILGVLLLCFRLFFGTFQSVLFFLLHPIRFFKSALADLSATHKANKDKLINAEEHSGIILIGGLFGTGKTANQVNYAISLYKQYSNVDLYSNVTLSNVNYTHFDYLEQILEPVPEGRFRVFLCDEFGSLFNSRNYKNCKFTEGEYLTMLNQVRKERKLLLVTSQRYHMVDKVFRQVAKEWWECNKYWRFLLIKKYDPLMLEISSMNSEYCQPIQILPTVNFLDDNITNYYDTHEIINNFGNRTIEIVDKTVDNMQNYDFTRKPRKTHAHSNDNYSRR